MNRLIVLVILFLITSVPLVRGANSTILKISVLDSETLVGLDAEIKIHLNSDFLRYDSGVASNGRYSKSLEGHGLYIIDIFFDGHFNDTDTLWILNDNRPVIEKTYFLKKIQQGHAMTLSNVNFYFNSIHLKEHSYPILDSVAIFILANPNVVLEVAGHTDDEGPAEYNLTLSEGRANAITKYLSSRGIDPSQLIARGYGEQKPIDIRITKAAKARNRRVELIVIDQERPALKKEGNSSEENINR